MADDDSDEDMTWDQLSQKQTTKPNRNNNQPPRSALDILMSQAQEDQEYDNISNAESTISTRTETPEWKQASRFKKAS